MKIKIDSVLKEFNSHFERAGFKAYLVGGAVRDIFLHKKPHDFDVATNATPQDVMKLFKVVIPTGFEHGTVTVHFDGLEIEVTTFRTETGYSDGRHPDTASENSDGTDDHGTRRLPQRIHEFQRHSIPNNRRCILILADVFGP